jgi:hypothetical protein
MRRAPSKTPIGVLAICLCAGAGCGDDASDPGAEPGVAATSPAPLSTGSPTRDEDPSLLRARDGSMFVAWFSDRDGAGDIYLARTPSGTRWSSPVRVTYDAGGDFYPSLFQDGAGVFHLTWFRWYALARGHILHSTSADGLTWSTADEESVTTDPDVDDWVPTPALASDGRLFVYFVSELRDGTNPTSEIYGVSKGKSDTNWSAPTALTDINSAAEHDQLPFVARTASTFTMVWVRHDTSQPLPWLNAKSQIYLSTSTDGTSWAPPTQVTNDAGTVVHLFPFILGQSVLWLSDRDGAAKLYELGLANVDQYPSALVEVTALPPGYSHRIARTSTPGVYLGAWVQGPDGAQEIYYRFFER